MKERAHKTVGQSLMYLREQHKYSIKELATLINIDAAYIKDWEQDLSEPCISDAMILSRLYGIPVDEMFSSVDVNPLIQNGCPAAFQREAFSNRLVNRWYE